MIKSISKGRCIYSGYCVDVYNFNHNINKKTQFKIWEVKKKLLPLVKNNFLEHKTFDIWLFIIFSRKTLKVKITFQTFFIKFQNRLSTSFVPIGQFHCQNFVFKIRVKKKPHTSHKNQYIIALLRI